MDRVLPVVAELAGRHPERTVFTRFIPPERPTDMPGMWQRYYTRWKDATREHLNPALLELLPPLAKLCPPGVVVDKTRYSAFAEQNLLQHLQAREADGADRNRIRNGRLRASNHPRRSRPRVSCDPGSGCRL